MSLPVLTQKILRIEFLRFTKQCFSEYESSIPSP